MCIQYCNISFDTKKYGQIWGFNLERENKDMHEILQGMLVIP